MNYVSCGLSTLYRDGGFYDTPEAMAGLQAAQGAEAECALVGELFPPFHYARPLPAQVSTDDPDFRSLLDTLYQTYNRDVTRGAAAAVVRLARGRLHGNVLYLASQAGGRVVYETHRPNDRPYVPSIDPANPAYPVQSMAEPEALNLFLGSAGTSNYGHWLVDDLPRAAAVAMLQDEAAGRPVHIWISDAGEKMNRVRNDSLLLSCPGLQIAVRVMPLDRVFEFEQLYYVTPVSYHPLLKSPDAMRHAAQPFQASAPAGSRLFVTRQEGRGRGLVNAAAVERRLVEAGFVVVNPEALLFAEQAAAFANAGVVVGSMGAAMTNTVFAPPGAKLLYLAPQGWVEPFYWDLAAVRGHDYSVLFGPVADTAQPAHLSRFSIDLAHLDRALAQLDGA